jgi:hypothetical protein
MSTGSKCRRLAGIFVLCLMVLCLGLGAANATSAQSKKKAKKPQLPALPSGPTGPIQQQIPLDSIPAVPPQVSFQNGQLTIVALNSTLGDILKAVRKQTGAEIEIPAANDRVVTRLGPGPAQEVMAELLNGSRFNYVVLGSPQDANLLTRVVLVPKTGADATPNEQAANQPPQVVDEGPPEMDDANNADATTADETPTDENAEQPQEAEQPAAAPEQPAVKTPQQMLQEMQQRQLQLQQQQQLQQQGQQPNPYVVQPPQPQEQQQ